MILRKMKIVSLTYEQVKKFYNSYNLETKILQILIGA